jgi:succinate-semialdehyde dehydrogenase/glutarate-semialdehyde dehydrogenase
VTLTGSVPVGKQLAELAAKNLIRCTLELGGHAPAIVFDDVDVEKVASVLTDRKIRLAGQACNSPSRFLVHERIYDRFITAFGDRMAAVRVGPGGQPATQMGPLLNGRRVAAMEALVADAAQHGASVVCGGERLPRPGFFYAPTVLGEVPIAARVMNEEPFGPIAACRAFDSVDEAIAEANRLDFGLAAYVFTRSAETAALLANRLEAGLVGLNSTMIALAETPFGGVKASGYGSEGGSEGVEGYLSTKYVVQAWESAV